MSNFKKIIYTYNHELSEKIKDDKESVLTWYKKQEKESRKEFQDKLSYAKGI